MRIPGTVAILAIFCSSVLVAQEPAVEEVVMAAALQEVQQQLWSAPPINLQHKRDTVDTPAGVVVVARKTIGGAPNEFRSFVDEFFGVVIAEDLLKSYGSGGPASRIVEQTSAGKFPVLPLEEFELGPYAYDWERLNQKYPEVRHVVRLSWPAVDRVGTFAVVRYELLGRDRPSTLKSTSPWQYASFVKFEKQKDGSWKHSIARIGKLWD